MDRLVDDDLAGLSAGYLAQKYGVHRATPSKYLTQHIILRRRPGPTIDGADEVVKLQGGGISMLVIARTLDVGRKRVRVSLVTAGFLVAS